MGIIAPEPPTFALKKNVGHQLFKNMITYTVWKFRKSKIMHQKNEIEQNLNKADLSSSLLSIRSYKHMQQLVHGVAGATHRGDLRQRNVHIGPG